MKITVTTLAAIIALGLLSACSTTNTTASATTTPSKASTATATVAVANKATSQHQQPAYCPKDLEIKTSAQHYLLWLDIDLKAIAEGKEACGSFSDWFAPNLEGAIDAGASKASVEKRIDLLVALANKGKFLSGFEEKLFNRKDGGGAAAVRRYAESVAGIKK